MLRWLMCVLGRHFPVVFEAVDGSRHEFCLWCGRKADH